MNLLEKSAFFEKTLIPTAQLVQLLIAEAPFKIRSHVAVEFQEPLNLVSAYALSQNPDMDALDAAIHIYQKVIRGFLLNEDGGWGRYELHADQALAKRCNAASLVLRDIYNLINYDPAARNDWFYNNVFQQPGVLAHQKTGAWRSLVRNFNIVSNLSRMGFAKRTSAVAHLPTNIGQTRLYSLWAETFGQGVADSLKNCYGTLPSAKEPQGVIKPPVLVSTSKTAVSQTATLSSGSPSRILSEDFTIPKEISVAVAPNGLIKVGVQYPAISELVALNKEFLRLNEDFSAKHGIPYKEIECNFIDFPAVIAKCKKELRQHREKAHEFQLEYLALVDNQKLVHKLSLHFSAEELKALGKYFKESSPS